VFYPTNDTQPSLPFFSLLNRGMGPQTLRDYTAQQQSEKMMMF